MYCIECGASLPKNSKFCPRCGKKQIKGEPSHKVKIDKDIIEKEITTQVIEVHKSSIDIAFLKQAVGWYFAWVLLHLALLLIGAESILSDGSYNDDFYPFNEYGRGVRVYDIREFLVYTLFPLAILYIIIMVRQQDKENTESISDTDEFK